MLQRSGRRLVGVDLRDGNCRAVLPEQGRPGWRVKTALEVPPFMQPPDPHPGLQLKRIRKKLCKQGTAVVVALGFQHVLIRRLLFPQMPMKRLRALVERDGHRYIPFYQEGACFDLVRLETEADPGQMEILLVAVPARVIQPILEACRSSGLRLAALDIDLMAMYRVVSAARPEGDKALAVEAVVEAGSQAVRIGLFEQGVLMAGRGITHSGAGWGELAVEIRRSLEVLLSQQPGVGRLNCIHLFGDDDEGSLSDALLPLLEQQMGPRLGKEFAIRLQQAEGAQFGHHVAFGASLAQVVTPTLFSLLPRRTQAEQEQRARHLLLGTLGAGLVGVYGWYWSQTVPEAARRIALAEASIRISQATLQNRAELQRLEARRKELEPVILDLKVSHVPVHELLPAMGDLAPVGLRVTDLSGSLPSLVLKGRASQPGLVPVYLGRLAGAPQIKSVELKSLSQTLGEYQFELNVMVSGDGKGKR